MIHWDGNSVNGFISFGETPKQALMTLKRALWIKLVQNRDKNISDLSEFSTKRLKSYLRSLKRPWRKTKRNDPMLKVTELTLPVYAGYWLTDIIRGAEYCNIACTNNPAEVYGNKAEKKKT